MAVHEIVIRYDPNLNPPFRYEFRPVQPTPRQAKFKHGDVLKWSCPDGTWIVFFKGISPVVDRRGRPLGTVDGTRTSEDKCIISERAPKGDVFNYGVILKRAGVAVPDIDDPEIIIDDDLFPPSPKVKRKPKVKAKRKPKV